MCSDSMFGKRVHNYFDLREYVTGHMLINDVIQIQEAAMNHREYGMNGNCETGSYVLRSERQEMIARKRRQAARVKAAQRVKARRLRRIVFTVLMMAAVLAGILIGKSMGSKVTAERMDEQVVKARVIYEPYKVHAGDTLWDMAQNNRPSSFTVNDYIKDVKRANNLHSDKILAGQLIVVPVDESTQMAENQL